VGMGLKDSFRRAVLGVLGIDVAEDAALPVYDRMALYPCEVVDRAADGSTVDIRPDNARIPPAQKVRVKVGIPGATAVVQQGARVLLGWEGGDPSKPYVEPSWEAGATVTKLVLNAQTVYLGAESGAEALVKKSEFEAHTHAFTGTTSSGCTSGGSSGTCTGESDAPDPITGTQNVRGK
jgi:hypothetical protein